MSASEIIESIKALPCQEQEKVVQFVRRMEAERAGTSMPISDDELNAVAEQVFTNHDDLFRKLAK